MPHPGSPAEPHDPAPSSHTQALMGCPGFGNGLFKRHPFPDSDICIEDRRTVTLSSALTTQLQLQRCIEQDNRYILLVNWKILEAHTEGFRLST